MPPENKPRQNGADAPFNQYAEPTGKRKLEMQKEAKDRNAKIFAQEKKIDELSKSPEIVSLLKDKKVYEKAQKANSTSVKASIEALSEYDKKNYNYWNFDISSSSCSKRYCFYCNSAI